MMGILIWHAVGYVGGVFISCVHCIDGEYQDRLQSGVTGVHCEDYWDQWHSHGWIFGSGFVNTTFIHDEKIAFQIE